MLCLEQLLESLDEFTGLVRGLGASYDLKTSWVKVKCMASGEEVMACLPIGIGYRF